MDLIKILKERLESAELDYQLCLENIDYPLIKADELRGNILAYRDCINLLERFNVTQKLERLEMELHCKNNFIKNLEVMHKSQIENYLQKENKLLDELIICKQQIKILKKALPYYNIKVLCNAGRITEEELEVLLKYDSK